MAYELKTKVNDEDVKAFLSTVEHEQRRSDAFHLLDIMTEVTGEDAKMWGKSIVGFGKYKYTYASGHSGEWMVVGFSPRKQAMTLYLCHGFEESQADLLKQLGPYKHGKACLYIKHLSDVDLDVLRALIKVSFEKTKHGDQT